MAPRAALAEEATAIPEPMPERLVARAAAMYPRPEDRPPAAAPVAATSAAASAACTLPAPPRDRIEASARVPKKKKQLHASYLLQRLRFFSPRKYAPNGTIILKMNAATSNTLNTIDISFSSLNTFRYLYLNFYCCYCEAFYFFIS